MRRNVIEYQQSTCILGTLVSFSTVPLYFRRKFLSFIDKYSSCFSDLFDCNVPNFISSSSGKGAGGFDLAALAYGLISVPIYKFIPTVAGSLKYIDRWF